MHTSVYDFVTRVLGRDEVEGKRVLEVGALDVNGSVRPYVTSLKPAEYIGTDRRMGRRVNIQVPASQLIATFGCDAFDIVICLETLEHMIDWRVSLWCMAQVLREGGLLVLTTRSPGFPRHEHPNDYWRFAGADLSRLFSVWGNITCIPDPDQCGVFVKARKRGPLSIQHLDTIHATRAPAFTD